jgi:hypothetical protein
VKGVVLDTAAAPVPAAVPDGPVSPVTGGPLEVVGLTEIADRLGVKPQTVAQWRWRCIGMPAEQWTVSGQPAWDWETVAAWARDTGRLDP